MSKADYRKIFCETCMSQSQCGYYRDNDGEYCPMLKFYDMGYHQAEKDLELTWDDIRIILDAENDIIRECNSQKKLVIVTYPKGEDYYGEILKRFKERKDGKEDQV